MLVEVSHRPREQTAVTKPRSSQSFWEERLSWQLHCTQSRRLWAAVYCGLNAISEYKSAMLYSLNAMTSYGHTNLKLEERWYLMGAMEALNGWILFGTHDGLSVRCD